MKPNIVFVLIDALRPRNLSLFGYSRETDRNIKKLASESILFTNNFSVSNASYPSLTSIFSGNYPNNSGIIHQYPNTEPEEIEKLRKNKFWLPVYLKNQGYETIATCTMDMWFKKGFDYHKAIEISRPSLYRKIVNNQIIKKILLKLPSSIYSLGKSIMKRDPALDFPSPEETSNLAIEKIKTAKKPFFLFVYFEDTHFPYARIRRPETSGKTEISDITRNIKENSQKEYVKKRFVDIKLKYLEQIKEKYDIAIKEVDNHVGRIIDFLKKTRNWDNTIFILTSDHGDSLDEHGIYLEHAGLYDEVLHVPLIMHVPGIKNNKNNELIQSIDISATILDLLKDKKNIDGKSLLSVIKGKTGRKYVYAYDGVCKDRVMVRTKNRKLIISKNGKCYLCGAEHSRKYEEYDIQEDPKETKNLYNGKSELEKYLKSNN